MSDAPLVPIEPQDDGLRLDLPVVWIEGYSYRPNRRGIVVGLSPTYALVAIDGAVDAEVIAVPRYRLELERQ